MESYWTNLVLRGAVILVVVIIAIVVSVLVFYLSTVKALTEHDGGQTLWVFEAICVFIFTVEVECSFVGTRPEEASFSAMSTIGSTSYPLFHSIWSSL